MTTTNTNKKKTDCNSQNCYFIFQMRIAMNSVGAIKTIDQDEKQLQDTIRYITAGHISERLIPVPRIAHSSSVYFSFIPLKVKL